MIKRFSRYLLKGKKEITAAQILKDGVAGRFHGVLPVIGDLDKARLLYLKFAIEAELRSRQRVGKPSTTKVCPQCKNTDLVLLRTLSVKVCPDCKTTIDWNLEEGQKPLLSDTGK